MAAKSWRGEVLAVQPRIRLTRSFDARWHSYLGYVLRMRGELDGADGEFVVGIGRGTQAKYELRAGDVLEGAGVPVADERLDIADVYRASAIRVLSRAERTEDPPPFLGVPPALEVYRERGHRRLAKRTFATQCVTCLWGCEMPVEMIIDQWNPSAANRYRRETFCYGPKSCSLYKSGPTRRVPGRQGMSYEEEDWVDEDATAHRGPDD